MNKRHSIKTKILLITTAVLIISNVAIGALGYFIAKGQLNEKGRTILKNGVESAIQMINVTQHAVEDGGFTQEEAQEIVKDHLIGELRPDGTRPINTPLDLGENGYFFILNEKGDTIAHPALEGENAWEYRDKSSNESLFIQDSVNAALNGGGFTYYSWTLPDSENAGQKIVYNELDPEWGWIVTASAYERDFNLGAINVLKTTSIGVLISFVIMTIIMYNFSNKMGKALERVSLGGERLANLDVREDVSQALMSRKDEIGLLANSFQKIVLNLRSFAGQINLASDNLTVSSNELKIASQESATAIDEVASAIEDIAQGASNQAMDTEEGAGHILDLGNLVEKNEAFLRELNTSTDEVDKLKDGGLETIKELLAITESSNKATQEIQEVIISTNESTGRIEIASNMIRSIAEQTNLLALNAAIEAARAGESGRGFAVVAEEIRKLAEETNGFTEEIGGIVADLISKTQQAVNTMEGVTDIVKTQGVSVQETNDKFMGISRAIENMHDVIDHINKSGQEMIGKNEMIIEIIQNLSAISQENAAGTEEVAASVEEQTATIAEIANASDVLSDLALEMKAGISKFKY